MQYIGRTWVALALACLALVSCAPAFYLGPKDLKGAVITYMIDILSMAENGHDNSTLTFDGTGESGTFETFNYGFDFITQAALDAGRYTDKTWYRSGGMSGSFAYDPEACTLTLSPTEVYMPDPAATPLSDGRYAAADYAYHPFAVSLGIDPDAGSAAGSYTQQVELTQDAPYGVFVAGDTDQWTNTTVETSTVDDGTDVTETEILTTVTYTIQDGSIIFAYVSDASTTVNGGTPYREHVESRSDYRVLDYFLVGEADDEDPAFGEVWRKGKTVTFTRDRIYDFSYLWEGETEPVVTFDEPDPVTGQASGMGVDYLYAIDANTEPWWCVTFTHDGHCIMSALNAADAFRGLGI